MTDTEEWRVIHVEWRDGQYYVSVPNWDGGYLVPVESYNTLARQLAEARESVEKFRTQVDGLKALLEMEHSHRGRMNRLHEMKLKAAERRAADESNRLDWIERQSDEFSFGVIVDAPGDGDYFVRGMGDVYATGKTFREVIDAAIAAGEKEGW